MNYLVIDDRVRENVKKVIEHAEKNPYTMDDLLDIMNKEGKIAGDMDGFSVYIPFDFQAVYSIELQKFPVRHLSVSVARPGQLPPIPAVEEIMKLFGFKTSVKQCIVRLEDCGANRQAVNVWEVII